MYLSNPHKYKNAVCTPVIHSRLWPPEMESTQTRHEKK